MSGKYEKWLQPDNLDLIAGWARSGLTDEQIAGNMGIRRSTLAQWRKKFPQIEGAIRQNKDKADLAVENSLYERCLGGVKKLRRPFKTKVVEYDEDTGRRIRETEKIEYADYEEYVPADTKAIIFWLTHRQPDRWPPNVEIKLPEDAERYGVVLLPEVDDKISVTKGELRVRGDPDG